LTSLPLRIRKLAHIHSIGGCGSLRAVLEVVVKRKSFHFGIEKEMHYSEPQPPYPKYADLQLKQMPESSNCKKFQRHVGLEGKRSQSETLARVPVDTTRSY
jgi:hypothetical protein